MADQLPSPDVATIHDTAPIARLHIGDDDSIVAKLYAPGLPPGSHDVWPCPVSAIPPGWKLMPIVPTDEILRAMKDKIDFDRSGQNTYLMEHVSQTQTVFKGEVVGHAGTTLKKDMRDAYSAALAVVPDGIRLAPDAMRDPPKLNEPVGRTEQTAFEQWLNDTTPMGDAQSVNEQWLESVARAAWLDETGSTAPTVNNIPNSDAFAPAVMNTGLLVSSDTGRTYCNGSTAFDETRSEEWKNGWWAGHAQGFAASETKPADGTKPWKPTETQILAAAETAGLWPNTVHNWIPAFDHFFDALALAVPVTQQPPFHRAMMRLDTEEATLLADFLSKDEDGESPATTLWLGDGHDGFGLYASLTEYPDEGAVHLTTMVQAAVTQQESAEGKALALADELSKYAAAPFFPGPDARGVVRATTAEWWDGLADLIERTQAALAAKPQPKPAKPSARALPETLRPVAEIQRDSTGPEFDVNWLRVPGPNGTLLYRGDHVAEALAAAQAPAVPAWISVEDRLPDDGMRVACTGWNYGDPTSGERWAAVHRLQHGAWIDDDGCTGSAVTHWMPLPAAPALPAAQEAKL